jgi:hypothetical protein
VSGNGEVLTVNAGPRESYDIEIRATATEQDGSGAATAEEFNAIGEIDGYRPGDLAVIVWCIKASIPIQVDWKRFEVPGREPQFNPRLWRERVLDEVSKTRKSRPRAGGRWNGSSIRDWSSSGPGERKRHTARYTWMDANNRFPEAGRYASVCRDRIGEP